MTLEKRFDEKFVAIGSDSCWLWTAGIDRAGYGRIGRGKRSEGYELAHRVSWKIHNGKIPIGLCVLHRCDVPGCVNPDHLFLGTRADNVDDMVAKGRRRNGVSIGEANGNFRHTDKQVAEIRSLAGVMFQREIAAKFGTSQQYISRLIAKDVRARTVFMGGM